MRPITAVALFAAVAAWAAASPAEAAGKKRSAEGTIVSFECGDNCYLTIRSRGRELTGLCSASACEPWNENTEIPRRLIGKTVAVTIEEGIQVDGSGNEAGRTDSFTSLTFR